MQQYNHPYPYYYYYPPPPYYPPYQQSNSSDSRERLHEDDKRRSSTTAAAKPVEAPPAVTAGHGEDTGSSNGSNHSSSSSRHPTPTPPEASPAPPRINCLLELAKGNHYNYYSIKNLTNTKHVKLAEWVRRSSAHPFHKWSDFVQKPAEPNYKGLAPADLFQSGEDDSSAPGRDGDDDFGSGGGDAEYYYEPRNAAEQQLMSFIQSAAKLNLCIDCRCRTNRKVKFAGCDCLHVFRIDNKNKNNRNQNAKAVAAMRVVVRILSRYASRVDEEMTMWAMRWVASRPDDGSQENCGDSKAVYLLSSDNVEADRNEYNQGLEQFFQNNKNDSEGNSDSESKGVAGVSYVKKGEDIPLRFCADGLMLLAGFRCRRMKSLQELVAAKKRAKANPDATTAAITTRNGTETTVGAYSKQSSLADVRNLRKLAAQHKQQQQEGQQEQKRKQQQQQRPNRQSSSPPSSGTVGSGGDTTSPTDDDRAGDIRRIVTGIMGRGKGGATAGSPSPSPLPPRRRRPPPSRYVPGEMCGNTPSLPSEVYHYNKKRSLVTAMAAAENSNNNDDYCNSGGKKKKKVNSRNAASSNIVAVKKKKNDMGVTAVTKKHRKMRGKFHRKVAKRRLPSCFVFKTIATTATAQPAITTAQVMTAAVETTTVTTGGNK